LGRRGFQEFLEILLLAYKVKPYKLEAPQPNLNVKKVVEIG
jgi:hypothetical protein